MARCIYARCKREIPEDAVYCPYCGRKQAKERQKRRNAREKGTGSVYKLPGDRRKPYYAVLNGKSTGRTYATKQEAAAALDAMLAMIQPDLIQYTLEDVYTAWSGVAYRDMVESSRRGYKLSWQYFPDALRKKFAREVRTDDVQAVIDDLQAGGKSDSTANHVKFLYSQLCKWMMQRDMIAQNYAAFLKVQKTQHRPTETFTVPEVSKINALASGGDPEDRLTQAAMLTMIFLFTGMRISEIFGLPVESVHLDGQIPYLQGGVKTEAGRNRIIPIYRRVLPYVRFFVDQATGPLLVSGYAGRKSSDGWRANDYTKMLAHLGIPYKVPHNTRKTLATNAAQVGMDQLALLKLMGWTDIAVGNQYYIAPDAAYLAAEMDKLALWDKKLDGDGKLENS